MRLTPILLLLGLLSLAVAGVVLPVSPAPIPTLKATLTSLEEVPALSTAGTGEFRARVVPGTSLMEYTLSYRGLEGGAVSGAHIHFGRAGVNGGVIAFLCGTEAKPCPPSGTVTGTLTPTDILGPAAQGIQDGEFAEVVRAILNGAVYVNLHTETYRAGELRGQISQGRGQ